MFFSVVKKHDVKYVTKVESAGKLNEPAFLNVFVCQVGSTHPECSIVLHLQKTESECKMRMTSAAAASLQSTSNTTAGNCSLRCKHIK